MSYDNDWPDDTMERRRKMIIETIRPITTDELREFGEKRFPVVTDPWCVRYNEFIKQNADAKFYQARIPGGVTVIYCKDNARGVWFLGDFGMGIIQPEGLQLLKEITAAL